MDRLQAQLHALASDPDTFLADPDPRDGGPADQDFAQWTCDLNKRQGEITDLMMSNPSIRKHYTDMVSEKVRGKTSYSSRCVNLALTPSHLILLSPQVSHKVFWTRYFFKVHLIELQEAKRQALRKRAEMAR